MAKEKNIVLQRKKEGRGVFLTILLALHGYILIALTPIIFSLWLSRKTLEAIPYASIQGLLFSTVDQILLIGILIGIFMWKKIAVYTYCIFVAINTMQSIIDLLFFKQVYSPGGFEYLFIFLLFLWAIKRKWHLFT